ncbi:MAG: DUF2721 domain-containing protein [Bacteroidota bacterium]|nr:DUF2721 domain-containing protein [Bacteroidota bacterium]
MEISLTTPALLFPAVSLLLLAYTNRFLAVASLIRGLHARCQTDPNILVIGQIKNLRRRVIMIRNMQALGIFSLFLCVLAMFVIYSDRQILGSYIFGASLLVLMASLAISIIEIQISIDALNLELSDMELLEGKLSK